MMMEEGEGLMNEVRARRLWTMMMIEEKVLMVVVAMMMTMVVVVVDAHS